MSRMQAILRSFRPAAVATAVGASVAYSSYVHCQDVITAQRPVFEQCPEIACKGSEELASMFDERLAPRPRKASSVRHVGENNSAPNAGATASSTAAAGGALIAAASSEKNCPPNREQLGRAAWTFLHATAAYYPEQPTDSERAAAAGLIQTLALLYPCKHCRAAFAADIQEHPPALNSRSEFSLWLCKAHNRVSSSLGKPTFPCEMTALDERWRTGRPECWAALAAAAGRPVRDQQTAEESLGQAADEDEA